MIGTAYAVRQSLQLSSVYVTENDLRQQVLELVWPTDSIEIAVDFPSKQYIFDQAADDASAQEQRTNYSHNGRDCSSN